MQREWGLHGQVIYITSIKVDIKEGSVEFYSRMWAASYSFGTVIAIFFPHEIRAFKSFFKVWLGIKLSMTNKNISLSQSDFVLILLLGLPVGFNLGTDISYSVKAIWHFSGYSVC